ncbi:MAG: VanZ family protein, partial [Saprospiraceae bacterium]
IKKYKWSLLWTLTIIILTLLPKNEMPSITFGVKYLDKVVHFIFYFILISLYLFEAAKGSSRHSWVFGFIICLVLGIGTEFGQRYLNMGRNFEQADIVANFLGNISGLLLFKVLLIGNPREQ